MGWRTRRRAVRPRRLSNSKSLGDRYRRRGLDDDVRDAESELGCASHLG